MKWLLQTFFENPVAYTVWFVLQVSYLKRLFPLIRELGATGVLLEWEDMFPFTGPLSSIAAGNAYSRRDVEEILTAARGSQLEVIPLVQTFGHVEFALKHPEFSGLREVPESPQALCPSLNASMDFVEKMIEQASLFYLFNDAFTGSGYVSSSDRTIFEFRSKPGDGVYRLSFSLIFLSPSRQILGLFLQLGHDLFLPFIKQS